MTSNCIKEIADKILAYLSALPDGTESCTSDAFLQIDSKNSFTEAGFAINGEVIDNCDLFEIDYAVRKNANKYGIILDSSNYDGMVIGLPYNIGYIVKRRK